MQRIIKKDQLENTFLLKAFFNSLVPDGRSLQLHSNSSNVGKITQHLCQTKVWRILSMTESCAQLFKGARQSKMCIIKNISPESIFNSLVPDGKVLAVALVPDGGLHSVRKKLNPHNTRGWTFKNIWFFPIIMLKMITMKVMIKAKKMQVSVTSFHS